MYAKALTRSGLNFSRYEIKLRKKLLSYGITIQSNFITMILNENVCFPT